MAPLRSTRLELRLPNTSSMPVRRHVDTRGGCRRVALAVVCPEFDTGLLMPGQSYAHTFAKPGEYFYNDPAFPQSTGKIVVQ